MRSRIIQSIILAIMLALAPPVAAVESDDKAAFKAAYKAYQEAVEAGDVHAVVDTAHDALHLGGSVFPDDSPSLAALYVNLGDAQLKNKNKSAAIEPLKEGLKRYEALYGKQDERLIDPLWWLADAYSGSGSYDKEGNLRRRVLRLVKENLGSDSYIFAEANLELGKSYYFDYRRQKRARLYLQAAYDGYFAFFGKSSYQAGVAAFWLGKAAELSRRRKTAEERYLEALDIFEKTAPPGHDLQLLAHTYLIKLYEDRGESDEADVHCQAISRLRPLAGVDGAKPLYRTTPVYPQSARRAGRSGWAIIEFTVSTVGTVSNATVVESKGGFGFGRAALDVVTDYRYAPAVKDGELVETTDVRHMFTFKITN